MPSQLIHIVEQLEIGSEGREFAEEQRILPFTDKRACEQRRIGIVRAPGTVVARNGFEVQEFSEHRS